jgi:hypothetical protein
MRKFVLIVIPAFLMLVVTVFLINLRDQAPLPEVTAALAPRCPATSMPTASGFTRIICARCRSSRLHPIPSPRIRSSSLFEAMLRAVAVLAQPLPFRGPTVPDAGSPPRGRDVNVA